MKVDRRSKLKRPVSKLTERKRKSESKRSMSRSKVQVLNIKVKESTPRANQGSRLRSREGVTSRDQH